jgi:uncharacterized protein (TIGR03435 family)
VNLSSRLAPVTLTLAVLVAAALFAASAVAQSPPPRAFEVASVAPSIPLQQQIASGQLRVGNTVTDSRIDLRSASLADMVTLAYRLKPYQLSGPDWIRSERYDVLATYPAGATKEQMPEMLQALLAERFKLVVRRETKEMPVYALVVGPDGHKLQPYQPTPPPEPVAGEQTLEIGGQTVRMGADGQSATVTTADGMTARMSQRGDVMVMEMSNVTMTQVVEQFGQFFLDRPLVDQTGLEGTYVVPIEIRQEDLLTVARAAAQTAGVALPVPTAGAAGQAADPGSSSMMASFLKLGFKFDSRRMPIDLIVVESAEKKPTEN